MAFQDAYQEAYVKFMELASKYKGRIDNPGWFMSLYKTSLANRVTDLANYANRLRRQVSFTELGDILSAEGERIPYQELLSGDSDNQGLLAVKLEQAPEGVREVLALLMESSSTLLEVLADSWHAEGKRKEQGNQFLCSLLGYDHRQVDLVSAVIDYLEE